MELVVCDLTGLPRGHAQMSQYQATASLSDPGDAEFTLRATADLYQWLAPWSGMLVVLGFDGSVLWSGVPVKRRGPIGSGEITIVAREWCHWLTRVSPLVFDSATPPFDDYGDYEGDGGVKAGAVVADLMGRIPQNRPGFVLCPLLPPDPMSGSLVTLGDLSVDVGRPSVWDALSPVRDRGVEMRAVTTRVGGQFVPRVTVGAPKLGNSIPKPLWLGSNVASAELEEDGDLLATRWQVKGSGESVEVFVDEIFGLMPPEGRLLLDNTRDYSDRFEDADDELAELMARADLLLRSSLSPGKWITDMEVSSQVLLEPGDSVVVAAQALAADPRLVEDFELEARVESVTISNGVTTVSLVQPEFDEAPVPSRRSLSRVLRELNARVSTLGMQ